MTRTTHTTQLQDSSEAKRWLIVGAYQAGAHEKQVARIAGLSRTAVRHILLNYQRTGSPSLPKRVSSKEKTKPVIEYDENGNIIDSEDEEEEQAQKEQTPKEQPLTRKEPKKPVPRKSPKIINTITAKHLTAYINQQATSEQAASEQAASEQSQWRPPTPPREGDTSTASLPFTPPSPPSSLSCAFEKTQRLPGPTKFDQTIRGYEVWTHQDDMLLLNHVLTRLQGGRWHELEATFEGRHTARLCCQRWQFLHKLLIKGMKSSLFQQWKSP